MPFVVFSLNLLNLPIMVRSTPLRKSVKTPVRTSVSEDGKTLGALVARPLAAGAYVINWRLAFRDGHRMTGSVPLTVR